MTIRLTRYDQQPLSSVIGVDLARVEMKPVTVLVVDGDVGVRRLIRMALTECGCAILEACNGLEAFLICRGRQSPIDLLIADIVMPHVNGMDLGTRLRRTYPAIKVLLMSSYDQITTSGSGPVIAREDVCIATESMRKPFSIRSLSLKVREILDSKVC